ncbi:MAG: MinD/ParA family protein [Planctomycetes bacterium]|nr:MinD/ParA family protein [Planctomycetota bacterium]
MGQVVSIHSYRGGTGKSNLTANLAWQAACRGRRVAVLDTDVQSPGVHMVLNLDRRRVTHTLSDYLLGRCELSDAIYDLSRDLPDGARGSLFLLPSSMSVDAIVRIASEGYDVGRLNEQLLQLVDALSLDYLLLDTHPGLNRETMLTTAVSDVLLVVIRPDTQDFHGTAVLMQVADRLGVPHVYMIANKVPRSLDAAALRRRIEETFRHEVLGTIPLDEDLAALGSEGLFSVRMPEHAVSRELETIVDALLARVEGSAPT